MSKPVRKTLSEVAITSYKINPAVNARIENPDTIIEEGSLSDERMGRIKQAGWPACEGDHAACFGTMGYISSGVYILNPAFEDIMIQYLRLFRYVATGVTAMLEMKGGIRDAINAHRTLTGYRRLKAISESLGTGGGTWKVWKEQASVQYKVKEDVFNISAIELKELLADATIRYTSEDSNIHLNELGLNIEVSKPEDFIIGYIPVLPNNMRIPYMNQPVHPITDSYKRIMEAVRGGDPEKIRDRYLDLIKDGDTVNLKDLVFSSSKKAFLRGHMLSKVGGQIARSVAAPSIAIRPNEVGVPRQFALDLSQRMEVTEENIADIRRLIEIGHITHILDLGTRQYIRIDKMGKLELKPRKMLVLRQLQDGDVVLVNRQPTLHRNSMLAFKVVLHDQDTIFTHPSVSTGFGLDYDG